jgi:hypothetical protein
MIIYFSKIKFKKFKEKQNYDLSNQTSILDSNENKNKYFQVNYFLNRIIFIFITIEFRQGQLL